MWSRSAQAPRWLSRLGDFVLIRRVGAGGMGIVYEAEHESLKSRMALKVMHPRFRADRAYVRRFQTEARSAAKLHHTNIVSVFGYGEQDGVCYYAMQYIVGVGLERVLEDVRRLRGGQRRRPGPATSRTGRRLARTPACSRPCRAAWSADGSWTPRRRLVGIGADSTLTAPVAGGAVSTTRGDLIEADGSASASHRQPELIRTAARLPARPSRSTSARSPG